MEELQKQFEELAQQFDFIDAKDIPHIDLYMDQVLTYLNDNLKKFTRDQADDRFFTKMMINNYTKNKVIPAPEKKKYSEDHMILLLMIFYLKSFLSLGDIKTVLEPLCEEYFSQHASDLAAKKAEDKVTLAHIYGKLFSDVAAQIPGIEEQSKAMFETAAGSFADAPDKERRKLQQLDLICQFSADIFIRKLFLERMIDDIRKDS